MSAENVTPAPEAEDAVVETPAGPGSRVADQDGAAASEAVRHLMRELRAYRTSDHPDDDAVVFWIDLDPAG